MSLLADYNMPFAIALVIMVLLTLVQFLGLDFGGETDVDFDAEVDADGSLGEGVTSGAASLLGLGRVPFAIWLAVFLFGFAAIGVSGQSLAQNLLGAPLDRWVAAILAGGAAVPVTSALVRPLGRLLPQDETTAVTLDTLVGRRATVSTGASRRGSPARAKTHDRHGQVHHVMVEPHADGAQIVEGEQVLLVRREGELFFGKKLEERRLAPTE